MDFDEDLTNAAHSALALVDSAFANWAMPSQVVLAVPTSGERLQIQADFGGVDRKLLTNYQCSMMLVDGALLLPEAYFYYLPRLARAVLLEGGNGDLLGLRLEALGVELLDQRQRAAVDCLSVVLDEMDRRCV